VPAERISKMAELIEATQPFKVRASCGHIVVRRMREATAGVPFTEETVLDAPNGRACDACEAAKAQPALDLECACCGGLARGRQWWNQDTGYAICASCVAWIRNSTRMTEEDIRSAYGVEGIHWGIK